MRPRHLLTPLALAAIGYTPVTLASHNRRNDKFCRTSFQDPPARARPRFRYWLPDASVSSDIVKEDIAAAAVVGAGGVEFVPFFDYGGQLGAMPQGADWSTYNFGTPAFRDVFKAALEAHRENGLAMDFALGPNQGQGVPADPDDEGLHWDLVPFTESIPENGTYTGPIPGWGSGELVALVSAKVSSNTTITYETSGIVLAANVTYDQFILAPDSLTDETSKVSHENGDVQLSFAPGGGESHYRLFAFYQKLSGHKNLVFTPTGNASIFDHGSFAVDHFSAKGAKTVTRFWEEHILFDDIPELIAEVGNYAWEDSLEMSSNISWSRSLPERFENTLGYSIEPFLPLLAFKQNNIGMQPDSPGSFECLLETESQGLEYTNDFRSILSDGYREYIETLTTWAHNTLHIGVSLQPSYGFPIDMLAAIPSVDAPECESLTFLDNIDSYRQFSGPAHLAGRRVISNELGAVRGASYQYTLPQLLFSANRGFAGGVNQYVLHGQPYGGSYFGTTWPGYTPFRYLFSEMWSPRQPVWGTGLHEVLEYLGRMQSIQQMGSPKVDVAIYNKQSATTLQTVYDALDLLTHGWSYTYLSPDNLLLEEAVIQDGVLAPSGPAWRAFVIEHTQNITLSTIAALHQYATAGLPIIFSGGPPGFYPWKNATDKSEFDINLLSLLAQENVYSVEQGQVASHLTSLGLRPRVGMQTTGTWYTTLREAEDITYVLVYGDLVASSGSIIVSNIQTPYRFDPWTGEISPVLIYQQSNDSTTIPISLAGNQTVLFAFSNDLRHSGHGRHPSLELHVTSAPPNVVGSEYIRKQGISLQVAKSASLSKAGLSDGRTIEIDSRKVPSAFHLSEWFLVAEHWEAPSNVSDESLPTVKYNTTHHLLEPTSWTSILGLENTSGIGYYNTTFNWPPALSSPDQGRLGASVSFSQVLNSLQVEVNGQRIAPLDLTNAVANISPYIREGENTLSIVVPTCWWNYLRTVIEGLTTSGAAPLPVFLGEMTETPLAPTIESGLVGNVTITPFKYVVI